MTVITRNQSKQLAASVKPVSQPITCAEPKSLTLLNSEAEFVADINRLLEDVSNSLVKASKMQICLQIYNRINANLEKFLSGDRVRWLKFAATAYNKSTEFENQREDYKDIDPRLVYAFTESYRKSRTFLSNYFKNLRSTRPDRINMTVDPYSQMYKNIDHCDFESAKVSRPRRNIPVMNYTGMDTIEPESEYDGITDIWFDTSKWYDSDYNPEDEEESSDEEEINEEFMRTKPFVTTRPKQFVQQIQPVVRGKNVRQIRKINYSGMDMNEDDDGTVSVCHVKWSNRVPTYKWVKYPASKANELEDDDWFEEY